MYFASRFRHCIINLSPTAAFISKYFALLMTNTSTGFYFMSTDFHIEQFYDRSPNFLSSACHSLDIRK